MPDPSKDLTAVIVTYKLQDIAQRAIDSFRHSGGHNTRLIVLDNSPERLPLLGVDEYHHHAFNPSLSRVWNWGLALARTRWVLMLNGDAVCEPGWAEYFERNERHFLDCKLHSRFSHFMIDRSVIRRVSWFDERLTTLYWEDTDFVRRLSNAELPWCSDCALNTWLHNERMPTEHGIYKEYYDVRAESIHGKKHVNNRDIFHAKWGDNEQSPLAGGTPAWEVENLYPCVELPE